MVTLREKLEHIARACSETGLPIYQVIIMYLDEDQATEARAEGWEDSSYRQCWIGQRDTGVDVIDLFRYAPTTRILISMHYARPATVAEREHHDAMMGRGCHHGPLPLPVTTTASSG